MNDTDRPAASSQPAPEERVVDYTRRPRLFEQLTAGVESGVEHVVARLLEPAGSALAR